MRADRLIAVLMILQTRGQITASELAEELEISTRTARRDLEALAMSGVPVYSQAGRGGGWRLIGGAKTDLTGLSSNEVQALFLALGRQSESNPVLEAALRKLVVAVPEQFRDDAVTASGAIRVDPTGWGQIGPAQRPQFVDLLSQAVIDGRQVDLRYTTPGKETGDRIVHPLGLVTKRGVWYLVAATDKGNRVFRLSRVQSAVLRDEPVERPNDFDLEEAWESIVTTVEARRMGVHVSALVDPAAMTPLRYIFANRHDIGDELPDGRIAVEIAETSPASLAAQLVGFGAAVELVDPPVEVAKEMTRITSELAAAWLPGGR